MKKTTLSLLVLVLIFTVKVYSQTDVKSDSKINVSSRYGITPQEEALENSKVTPSVNPPSELFTQLDNAKRNGNISEAERINSEIAKYSTGIKTVIPSNDFSVSPAFPGSAPPFFPDWVSTDVTVYSGNIAGSYNTADFRVMDMKTGKDGNLYLAFATDSTAGTRYIWVYRSTNSGATWTALGGVQTAGYFHGLSMSIDRRATTNDSMKVAVYFTISSSSVGNGAALDLLAFTANNFGSTYIIKNLALPTTGRKFRYPSAATDGAYYDALTYIGCVYGEYSNSGDSVISMGFTRTTNWHSTYVTVNIPTVYTGIFGDYYPSACLKRSQSVFSDSVYIAVERRFTTTNYLIRIIAIPWSPTASASTLYIPPTGTGIYTKPSLTVRQTQNTKPREILVTYMKNDVANYFYSNTDGSTWNIDFSLDLRGLSNSVATYCSSDSLTSSGCFAGLFKQGDSISVRRGILGSLGTPFYKVNSHQTTTSRTPVCCIYRNGTSQYTEVSFPGLGPTNIYFNGENMLTNVSNTGTVPKKFNLNQNYPNPFNPVTTINFSIPSSEYVKITVYDILGKEITTLVNEKMSAGTYNYNFNAGNLSSGIYFYKISAGEFNDIKKMMLIK